MNLLILLKGISIGFIVAMPIGPIGLLCIQRTLIQGRFYGMIFGLGIATADAIYGSIASFGINFISNFLLQQKFWIKLFGGLFLLFFSIKILFFEKNTISTSSKLTSTNLLNDYLFSLLLTLTNPITILTFIIIFSVLMLNIIIYLFYHLNILL